jgi:hypothetical protein
VAASSAAMRRLEIRRPPVCTLSSDRMVPRAGPLSRRSHRDGPGARAPTLVAAIDGSMSSRGGARAVS